MNAGHNSGELTEDEEKVLFLDCVRKDIEHQSRIKALQDARKADRKIFQSYKIVLSDMDYAIRAMQADDKGVITARHIQQSKINYWLGLTSGYQSDLFVDRAAGFDLIEREGELKGLVAAERVSPYAKGSDETDAWLRGYDKAQKARAENLQSAMEKLNAAKTEHIKSSDDSVSDDPFLDDEDQEAA